MEARLSRLLLSSALSFASAWSFSQGPYASEVGTPGTTAIHKDSSIFVSWASECDLELGYIDITDKSQGFANTGSSSSALGIADGDIVSLGDSGTAIITFAGSIYDGSGPDFAVFENSFSDYFLELAKVFVSSDGVNFHEFPSHSLTPDTADIGGFGTTDPRDINNLAGKYRAQFGTPFDLSEMQGISGLDINNIVAIKLIDAVGTSDPQFATLDTAGNKIIDPFTTPFPSSGFDLDAIGVIHLNNATDQTEYTQQLYLYPNPCRDQLNLMLDDEAKVSIYNSMGALIQADQLLPGHHDLDISNLLSGHYIIILEVNNKIKRSDFVKI